METTEKIFTYENDFQAFNAAMDAGQLCRVDEEMFYYWLEVLPPIYMNKEQIIEIDGAKFKKMCSFGFAEGRDYIIDFWRNKDADGKTCAFFAKRSTRLNRGG